MRKSLIATIFLAIAIGAFLLGGVGGGMSTLNAMPDSLSPSEKPIPAGYFGLHIHRAVSGTPWPPVKFGTWRLWDTYTAWPWLEPKKGKWDFDKLDKLIGLAEKNQVEIVLVLGLSPPWASARPTEKCAYAPGFAAEPGNIDDWKNYVRRVATRYKGRIYYYEMWNEPNLKNFFSGTTEQMIVLSREAYRILKEVDPANLVISPSATGKGNGPDWINGFLSQGGGKYADVIGYHFYVAPGPPEAMVTLIAKIKKIMEKHGMGDTPLWNTESGWFITNKLTLVKPRGTGGLESRILNEEEAAPYVAKSYILNWASGVSRFIWYSWDNKDMGLAETDGKTLKLPAKAYAEIYDWLVGTIMESCDSDSRGTWTCRLSRDGGYKAWIVWNPEETFSFSIPAVWGVQQARDLSGAKRIFKDIATIEIGSSPLLMENRFH